MVDISGNTTKMWAGRAVLVTGGSGFLGKRVVQWGLSNNIQVHSASFRAEADSEFVHRLDITNREECQRILQHVNPVGLIHLAAGGVKYGIGTFPELFRVNAVGLDNLLSSLERPIPVVIAGSGFEYASQSRPIDENDVLGPTTAYGASKLAAFGVATAYALQMPVTWLRPFSLYGIGEQSPRLAPYIIEQTSRGLPCDLTEGEQIRDYLYADDAAFAFWRALLSEPLENKIRVLNIGTGMPITLRQFAEELGQALQEFHMKPDLRFGAKAYRPNEMMVYTAKVERAAHVLGWHSTTELRIGLHRMVKASLEQ